MPSAGPADVTGVVISPTTFDHGCVGWDRPSGPVRPGPVRHGPGVINGSLHHLQMSRSAVTQHLPPAGSLAVTHPQ